MLYVYYNVTWHIDHWMIIGRLCIANAIDTYTLETHFI